MEKSQVDVDDALRAMKIRGILAQVLDSQGANSDEKRDKPSESRSSESLTKPAALIDSEAAVKHLNLPKEQHSQFVEAVRENLSLQKQLAQLRADHNAVLSIKPENTDRMETERALLNLQLQVNELEKEYSRLSAINSYYTELSRMPAASPDFLDPAVMFKDFSSLPKLPKDLVEGFTKDLEAPEQEIQDLVSRIRKATLREKLALQRDEKRLAELKAKDPIDPSRLPLEVQVEALQDVKNSLVNWIETMLSKAGEGDQEETPQSPVKGGIAEDDVDYNAHLADIQKLYSRHLEFRRRIEINLAQIKELSKPSQPKAEKGSLKREEVSQHQPEPQTYLLAPYLENLAALAIEQRSLTQERAHINSTITRQKQATRNKLRHVAQTSELLSKYTSPDADQSDSQDFTKGPNVASQIRPWLYAADSVKIATLESVAEAVDAGQMAIDDAMQALDQTSRLQNKAPLNPLSGERASASDARKDSGKKSIWSSLDGNLGLINE
ncbi:hypothetical protein GGR57DRAFT_212811 [Xylariaceae sp. FL1272]|nr:hypothetical protein GGR57DRAFT_212811 [Xylariaceae sp. FL1272]